MKVMKNVKWRNTNRDMAAAWGLLLLGILWTACQSTPNTTDAPAAPTVTVAASDAATQTVSEPRTKAVGEPVKEDYTTAVMAASSPAGWAITVWGPSDKDGDLYFFEGGKVVNRYYEESALLGEWTLDGDQIALTYTERHYRKGIGEPIAPSAGVSGNYIPQYAEYTYASEAVGHSEVHDWPTIKESLLASDGMYAWKRHNLRKADLKTVLDLSIVLEE